MFPRITNPLPAYAPVAVNNANIISFVKNDPLGCGVTAAAAASPGNDTAIMNVVNAVSPSFQVPAGAISSYTLLNLIDATEFNTMTVAQQTELQTILSVQTITIGDPATQAKLDALLTIFPKSLAAVKSQYTQAASPWAYWFGAGQSATIGILDSARNSGNGNNF